jgi:hypothetical protein
VFLILNRLRHVGWKQSKRMHQSFFGPEVIPMRCVHLLTYHRKIVCEVRWDLHFSSLANVADSLDHLLVRAFNIPGIWMVHLESHILDWLLLPHAHLVLAHKKQGQCEVVQNGLNVWLAHLAHFVGLKRHWDEPKRRIEGLSAYKLFFFRQKNVKVRIAKLACVALVEFCEKAVLVFPSSFYFRSRSNINR